MKLIISLIVTCMFSVSYMENSHKKEEVQYKIKNRRYIHTRPGMSYEYRFQSNGNVKFIFNHFELGKRTRYGKYEMMGDTINISMTVSVSGNKEQYLVTDSCLTDFKGNCLYKRIL